MSKIPVGVLGATGTVGQRFVQLLADHPWFEVVAVTGSDRTVGRPYGEGVNWMMPGDVPFTVVNQVVTAEVARGKQVLSEVRDELRDPALKVAELQGSPAETISALAEEEGFDLVVVGSRGRNAVARLFLGSVADRLVHICKKPVLIVR